MVELRNLNEDVIKEIGIDKMTVTQKFYGTKIIVKKSEGKTTYLKNQFLPITRIDLLMSDLYSKPIEILESIEYSLPPNPAYYFTYNYTKHHLFFEEHSKEMCKMFDDNDKISAKCRIFEGYPNATMMRAIEKKNEKKIVKMFDIDSEIKSLIFDLGKHKFKIEISKDISKHTPSEIYNLILVDVIRSVDINSINKIFVSDNKSDWIYTDIIDKIFISWLNRTKFKVAETDLNYPDYMKVDVNKKLELLNPEIREIIAGSPTLYNSYVMFLSTFKKPVLKSNNYLTGSTKEKHSQIYNEIKRICIEKVTSTSIPSFYEMMGESDI